ncbi:pyridoxal phosphate-dependent transferase [Pelagophyceae sp. CCMP2097]|nr:pyridoxal phosphate-dependent transferase [Pelagophyceae sp. CCMP2097]
MQLDPSDGMAAMERSAVSRRGGAMASFKVMDVLRAANAIEAAGETVYHLEVGQPRTGAPPAAVAAAQKALSVGSPMGYTNAFGTESLRLRIAKWYADTAGARVDAGRVVITTGSSAGFVLAFSALFDAGDHVAVPSVAYPCYRNVLQALGCVAVPLGGNAADPCDGFALPDAAAVRACVEAGTPLKGLILSSPSNPTGAVLDAVQLEAMANECKRLGITFISDEIYHHISYDGAPRPPSAVSHAGAVVVNSFSKFFSMTGWRIGWVVLPEGDAPLAAAVERLQQNMYINAPTISQVAAEAAFDDADGVLRENVESYARNREIVLKALHELGFDRHCSVACGAFYIYADLRSHGITDTPSWCARLLRDTGVALTPGVDFEFDEAVGRSRVRFSYCGGNEDVAEAMRRLTRWVLDQRR